MNRKQKRIRLIIIIPAVILWLTVNLYFFWIKVGGGVLLVTSLVSITCFLAVLITTIILTIKVLRQPDWRNLKNYSTIGLTVLVLTALNIKLLRANENTLQSPVKMRVCYEGTMNTSYLYLRENGNFEDFNIGFFAYVHYYKGTWTQKGDTLQMHFEGGKPRLLEDKLIIKDNNIYKIQADTLVPTYYYMGNCKGLN